VFANPRVTEEPKSTDPPPDIPVPGDTVRELLVIDEFGMSDKPNDVPVIVIPEALDGVNQPVADTPSSQNSMASPPASVRF
jgi:hypothetical protein